MTNRATDSPPPLDRLLQHESDATIEMPRGTGDPTWVRSGDWRVFVRLPDGAGATSRETLMAFEADGGRRLAAGLDARTGVVHAPFDLHEAFENYAREAWRQHEAPRQLSSGQLNAFYRVKRFIPRAAQLAARRALIRWQGLPEFPAWPLDLGVVKLVHLYGRLLIEAGGQDAVRFRWFWPAGYHAAAILTHDVESADGLRLALELADLEEERGLRSSFNVVADWYPIDHGILRELRSRGFEIGVHGVHHDRSMFATRESFEAQQPAVRAAAEAFEAEGFRSPATHRVYDWLADLPVSYDCSVPHSDPFEPQPGGCCSLWPFHIGDVVEMPYSLPQDHTLLTLLRRRSATLWIDQLDAIARHHGLAQALTHPDPGYLGDAGKRAIYVEFLDHLATLRTVWTPLPRDVAGWWRERANGASPEIAHGTIRRGDGYAGVSVEPPDAPG